MVSMNKLSTEDRARILHLLWEVADIVALVEAEEAKAVPTKRGPYKKKDQEISN